MNIDLIEGEHEYRIVADLPGVDPNNLNVSIEDEDRTLVIQAERKSTLDRCDFKHANLEIKKEGESNSNQCDDIKKQTEKEATEGKDKEKEKSTPQDRMIQQERCYGKIERRMLLPKDVDVEKAQTKFVDGVLIITVPKRKDLPPAKRQLKIESA